MIRNKKADDPGVLKTIIALILGLLALILLISLMTDWIPSPSDVVDKIISLIRGG